VGQSKSFVGIQEAFGPIFLGFDPTNARSLALPRWYKKTNCSESMPGLPPPPHLSDSTRVPRKTWPRVVLLPIPY
jgi:hypothetical protein